MAKKTVERKCENCQHVIFNRMWGEYKCRVKKRYIPYPELEARACDRFTYRNGDEAAVSKEEREKYESV